MKKTFLLSSVIDLGLVLILVCGLFTTPLRAQSFEEFVGAPALRTETLYAEKNLVYDDSTEMIVITNPTTHIGQISVILYTDVISDTLYFWSGTGLFKRNILSIPESQPEGPAHSEMSGLSNHLGVTDSNGALVVPISPFLKYFGISVSLPSGKKVTRCVVRMMMQ